MTKVLNKSDFTVTQERGNAQLETGKPVAFPHVGVMSVVFREEEMFMGSD